QKRAQPDQNGELCHLKDLLADGLMWRSVSNKFQNRKSHSPRNFPGLPEASNHDKLGADKTQMKAVIYAQLNPVKTMQQLICDRCILRVAIIAGLLLAVCR